MSDEEPTNKETTAAEGEGEEEHPLAGWPASRRSFLVGWGAFAGSLAVGGAAFQRFLFPNVLFEPPMQFKVGPPDQFPPGTVATQFKQKYGAWIVHLPEEGIIVALQAVCTHLGCTPNWLEAEQKFKCPCHGSGFYMNGINFEGPAPRPLERYAIRIAPDGQLLVDKTRTFHQEKGEWDDPASFVKV